MQRSLALSLIWVSSILASNAFASSPQIPLAQQLDYARQRPENYCHGVVSESSYDDAKTIVVLVDKESFCTYLLQLTDNGEVVSVFSTPNSLGRVGHETRAGHFAISRIVTDPVWVNPVDGTSIRPYSIDRNNPLGVAALTIKPASVGIRNSTSAEINMALHGTNRENLVGKRRVSASCIRHFNWAIALMVQVLQTNERVEIVDRIDSNLSLPVEDFQ